MSATPIDLHWVQQPGTSVGALHRPTSFVEALQRLNELPKLRPVAGATDLLLELARSGQGNNVDLLDLTRIEDFAAITYDDATGTGSLGAGVTHAQLLADALAPTQLRPLAQACLEIGSPQLRNRATIAGNVVTASPANDTISALVALDASVSIASWSPGQVVRRTVPIADLYSGFRETVLTPTELIESFQVPLLNSNRRGIWVKAGLRKAQAISVVHAGFVVELSADGIVTDARIALGSVGPTVELNEVAAQQLLGQPLTTSTISHAAEAAADGVSPIGDGRATADYRSNAVVTVVSRALAALAAEREHERWPSRVPLLASRIDSRRHTSTPTRDIEADAEVTVTVNGTKLSGRPSKLGSLLDWLRDNAGTGTKEGCAEGECGACTVRLDEAAVMSCLVPATQADGARVGTVEGLAADGETHPVQDAFVEKFAVQCGYCIPGFIVAVEMLAAELDSVPTRDEVELALSGNLCRCTGYYNIIDAVMSVF